MDKKLLTGIGILGIICVVLISGCTDSKERTLVYYETEDDEPSKPSNYCGDGKCSSSESCSSCSTDCGKCPEPKPSNYCGDGRCSSSESCSSCPEDCGECPKPKCKAHFGWDMDNRGEVLRINHVNIEMDAEKIEMVNMIETDNNNCNYVCIRAGLYLSGANVLYEDSVSDFTYDITDRSSQRVTAIIDYSDLSIKHYDHLIKLEVYEGKCRKDLDISDKLDYKWTKSFTHKCLDTEGYCQ